MTEYDVIVCGGGPSGSTTAFYAAKAGMKVLLIDKSKKIRKKWLLEFSKDIKELLNKSL